ncbi:hypothetical protein DL96DRAFT_1557710 [Flagelloscypha sp. PMI_526]|nr:hypothetical protein DL96DRAFT_1557710 [Flagelloscypha sp. PMI_526]
MSNGFMHLFLSERNFENTMLIFENGQPLYQLETKSKFMGSSPTNFYDVQRRQQVGQVEFHSMHGDDVTVNGYKIKVKRESMFSTSEHWKASNRYEYKWKWHGENMQLERDHHPVATFSRGDNGFLKHKDAMSFQLSPEAQQIRDEVIVTGMYTLAKAERDKGSQNGAINAATAGNVAAISS